jgi:hypothetical protein
MKRVTNDGMAAGFVLSTLVAFASIGVVDASTSDPARTIARAAPSLTFDHPDPPTEDTTAIVVPWVIGAALVAAVIVAVWRGRPPPA